MTKVGFLVSYQGQTTKIGVIWSPYLIGCVFIHNVQRTTMIVKVILHKNNISQNTPFSGFSLP